MTNTKTIDDYIDERNKIQFEAEAVSDHLAAECWVQLGVANRHITRLVEGTCALSLGIAYEIEQCFVRAREWLRVRLVGLKGKTQ